MRAVNEGYLRLRHRLLAWRPMPAELGGAVALDESYSGPRRVRGKQGRRAGGKTIVFGLCKRGATVYPEIVPDCSKRTLQAIIRGKIDVSVMVNTDGWRGYDGLVDVGFDRHDRVRHGQDEFVHGAAHINGIESFWRFAKAHPQPFKGVAKHPFLLHLKEVKFRFNHRHDNVYKLLLKLLRQQPL